MTHMRARMGILFTAIVVAATAPAAAQDVAPLEMAKIRKGTVVRYVDTDGSVETHRFDGPSGKGYRITVLDGEAASGRVRSYSIVDANGQVLLIKPETGGPMRFTPHLCNRAIGTCQFQVRFANGVNARVTARGRLSGRTLTTEYRALAMGFSTRVVQELGRFGGARSVQVRSGASTASERVNLSVDPFKPAFARKVNGNVAATMLSGPF